VGSNQTLTINFAVKPKAASNKYTAYSPPKRGKATTALALRSLNDPSKTTGWQAYASGVSFDVWGWKGGSATNPTYCYVKNIKHSDGVTREGFVSAAYVTLSAHAHTWGGWTVTKAATATATGSRKHTCKTCGGTASESIPATGGGSGGRWPTPSKHAITDHFGYRHLSGNVSFHQGIDIPAALNSIVYPIMGGVVSFSDYLSDYGNCVIVEHTINGKKYHTRYAHLVNRLVIKDAVVTTDTQIGKVGDTGSWAQGIHLHMELWKSDTYKWNQVNTLKQYGKHDTRANSESNSSPLFIKNSSGQYVFNSSFNWDWNEVTLPAKFSHANKYYTAAEKY
jgi:murein DD-endopeptidase MepM/ murein hydrolase activator NlpD